MNAANGMVNGGSRVGKGEQGRRLRGVVDGQLFKNRRREKRVAGEHCVC